MQWHCFGHGRCPSLTLHNSPSPASPPLTSPPLCTPLHPNHLQGKDVFEAFYKRDLAKRLMLGKSASEELEKGMIAKLKAECGAQFTAKLEGMFNDMEVSRDLLDSFHRAQQFTSRLPAGVDVNVQVGQGEGAGRGGGVCCDDVAWCAYGLMVAACGAVCSGGKAGRSGHACCWLGGQGGQDLWLILKPQLHDGVCSRTRGYRAWHSLHLAQRW